MEKYIPKEDLKTGKAYEVDGRNYDIAIWDGGMFHGVRNKFGCNYISGEDHWDDDGTVKPLRELE